MTQSGTVTEGEFESASQVEGHTPFPQWEAGSAVGKLVPGEGSFSLEKHIRSYLALQALSYRLYRSGLVHSSQHLLGK